MPKHLIRSNMFTNNFGDPFCGAHHKFNFCSNLTNYDFRKNLTCLKNVHKISDQNSIIWAVFKTQTFYYSKKTLFWHIWPLGKELGIALSRQIEIDRFLILNASTQKFHINMGNENNFSLDGNSPKNSSNFG